MSKRTRMRITLEFDEVEFRLALIRKGINPDSEVAVRGYLTDVVQEELC